MIHMYYFGCGGWGGSLSDLLFAYVFFLFLCTEYVLLMSVHDSYIPFMSWLRDTTSKGGSKLISRLQLEFMTDREAP